MRRRTRLRLHWPMAYRIALMPDLCGVFWRCSGGNCCAYLLLMSKHRVRVSHSGRERFSCSHILCSTYKL